jgi:hypothetical protein
VSGKTGETNLSSAALLLWALIPVIIWAGALKHVGNTIGYHSTPGIWLSIIGFPGVVVSDWIYHWTRSEPAAYFAALLGNWMLWFGLLKGGVMLKRRLHRSKPVESIRN